MAILPNSVITVVRISVYHQPQVWLPLLKSEPYFLNCPWFLLAEGYTTELNFKFRVVTQGEFWPTDKVWKQTFFTSWVYMSAYADTQSLPLKKGHQLFLLLIAEMVWVWLKTLRWAAVQKKERERRRNGVLEPRMRYKLPTQVRWIACLYFVFCISYLCILYFLLCILWFVICVVCFKSVINCRTTCARLPPF